MTTFYLVDTYNLTGYAQVVEELQSGVGVTKAYTYGHDLVSQRQGSAVNFYQYDGHGSVRMLTDAAAQVTDTYTYDAFGSLIERTGTTDNNYLYAGEQFDPHLDLYYNRARYLNVDTGRFTSQDLYGGDSTDPSSLHKYLYANNDPANKMDPSGLFSISETLSVVGINGIINTIATASIKGAIGGTIFGGVDAYLRDEDVFSGAQSGAIGGALLGPIAMVRYFRTFLAIAGAGLAC